MSAPTAAEMAIVLDIIVRKTLMARRRWFRRTARTSPSAMPIGTVYSAKIAVASRPVLNAGEVRSSR